jgi:hypothetical protein
MGSSGIDMTSGTGTSSTIEIGGLEIFPDHWPAEVDQIISALEAAGDSHDNRRQYPRMPYRVMADLRLFSDPQGIAPWRLYTRDVSARGLGFITPHRLPLGYGGVVQIPSPAGRMMSINSTLFRCRDIGGGFFEGALYFNREQWVFAPKE